MLVNAGGLLAIANGAFNSKLASPSSMILTAMLYVGGPVFALACAYSAYLNFGAHSSLQREFQAMELWDIAKRRVGASAVYVDPAMPSFLADGRSFQEYLADTAGAISDSEKRQRLQRRVIGVTFWTGQITGILSATAFVAACFTMAFALSHIPT